METDKAKKFLKTYENLKSDRITFVCIWDEISRYVTPHRSTHVHEGSFGSYGTDGSDIIYDCDALYDTTATHAADTLAQGMLSHITPMESPWFNFMPPEILEDNEAAKSYYNLATETVKKALFDSNFYQVVHEFYIDRAAYGTAAMRIREGSKTAFSFKSVQLGTYCIAHNEEGMVDQFFREFHLTGRQAIEEFGDELPKDTMDKAKDKPQKRFLFVHGVEKRPEEDIDPSQPLNPEHYAYSSVYFCMTSKEQIGKEGGLKDFPYLVSRYRNWHSNTAYGWCPSILAMPDIVQLNFLEKMLDFKAEQEVMPPLVYPDKMEGQLDLRGGSLNATPPGVARGEIGRLFEQGRYDIGEHRSEHKREMINKAYHVNALQLLSQLNDSVQRTEDEIHARLEERVLPLSPTFSQLIVEMVKPLLQRCFNILYERGDIPPPPQEILQEDQKGIYLQAPEIQFTGRIALALEQAQNSAAMESFRTGAGLAEAGINVMDNVDWNKAFRGMARNYGMPEKWLTSMEEMEEMKMLKALEAEQQAEMAQAEQVAGIANQAAPAVEALEQIAG